MTEASELLMSHAARYLEENDDHWDLINDADTEVGGSKPWGQVIAASFLVNLATFSGLFVTVIFVVIPRRIHEYRRRKQRGDDDGTSVTPMKFLFSYRLDNLLLPAFAAGALLSTTVFLLIPESILLLEGGEGGSHDGHNHRRALKSMADMVGGTMVRTLQDGHDHSSHEGDGAAEEEDGHEDSHGAVAWKFGVALLAGYLLPILLHNLFPVPHHLKEELEHCQIDAEEEALKQREALLLQHGNGNESKLGDDVDVDAMIDAKEVKDKEDSTTEKVIAGDVDLEGKWIGKI